VDTNAFLVLIGSIVLGVAGQLLLKRGMTKRPGFRMRNALALADQPEIAGGFLAYGISTLLYLKSLASLDLAQAYPMISLGYVLVVLASRLFFGERVSASRWVAVLIICAGVALVGLAAG
jgi:undecaprenyl phosphate-alpha-L-ara4N flippase subunit ArnE